MPGFLNNRIHWAMIADTPNASAIQTSHGKADSMIKNYDGGRGDCTQKSRWGEAVRSAPFPATYPWCELDHERTTPPGNPHPGTAPTESRSINIITGKQFRRT